MTTYYEQQCRVVTGILVQMKVFDIYQEDLYEKLKACFLQGKMVYIF